MLAHLFTCSSNWHFLLFCLCAGETSCVLESPRLASFTLQLNLAAFCSSRKPKLLTREAKLSSKANSFWDVASEYLKNQGQHLLCEVHFWQLLELCQWKWLTFFAQKCNDIAFWGWLSHLAVCLMNNKLFSFSSNPMFLSFRNWNWGQWTAPQ
jgi:hypothetical protein